LRHTFASLLFAVGEDPPSVTYQLGHTDPAFTLRVYAHAMRADPRDRARLRAIVAGHAGPPDDVASHPEWMMPARTNTYLYGRQEVDQRTAISRGLRSSDPT